MVEGRLISLQEAYNMVRDDPFSQRNLEVPHYIAGVESVDGLDLDKLLKGQQVLEKLEGRISNLDLGSFDLLMDVGIIFNSRIRQMLGSSRVEIMSGSSKVERMYDSSQVRGMSGFSEVGSMSDFSKVGNC